MSVERFHLCVPFIERVRWLMLKLLIDGDQSLKQACAAIGLPLRHMREVFLGRAEPSLRDIGYWAYAFGAELDFKMIPKES